MGYQSVDYPKSSSGLGSVGACAAPPNELQGIAMRLDSLNERLSETYKRLAEVNSRAFGQGRKDQANTTAPKPVRSGNLGAITDKLDTSKELAEQIVAETAALEQL